jgi:hypothetical protein
MNWSMSTCRTQGAMPVILPPAADCLRHTNRGFEATIRLTQAPDERLGRL